MKGRLRLVIVMLLLSTMAGAQTVQYRSVLIKGLAAKASQIKSDYDIVTEYDDMGRVANVGLDLFDTDMFELFPEDVCRFIERYFVEVLTWDETSMQQKLRDDKVVFLKGDPEDVLKLPRDCEFSLNKIEDKSYIATWSKDGKQVLSFSFPIQCELLLGMPQSEIEQTVKEDLLTVDTAPAKLTIPETELASNGLYRSIPVANYYVKELTDCTYYKELKNGNLEPVFDAVYPEETMANLFHIASSDDFKMTIHQSLYGFKSIEYEASLKQWLAFCRKNGLTSYFAIEKSDDDSYLVLIIAESKSLAYNHLLSVAIPKDFMKSKTAFKAKLNAYIPTHNISELYQTKETRANE